MGDNPVCSVEPHTTKMVCVNCISPGYFMGLCFMVLFSLCLPFWVKAPNPACFQGADLISCLLSEYAYQKKKKKKYCTVNITRVVESSCIEDATRLESSRRLSNCEWLWLERLPHLKQWHAPQDIWDGRFHWYGALCSDSLICPPLVTVSDSLQQSPECWIGVA